VADKKSRRTLSIVLFSCIAVMVAFAGVAVAAFTVSGDGLAAGAVAEVKPLIVTEGKIATGERVIPGGSGVVSVKIKNPNVFDVEVTLAQDGPITTDVPACDPAWFSFIAPTELIVVAAGKSLTVDLPDALAMSIDAGTECSSAGVKIPVAVAGVQIVDGTTTTTQPVGADCTDPPSLAPGADLVGCDLSGLTLDANLTGANLTNTNLTNTDLYGTNLTDANLTGANLTDADADLVVMTGANLTGANLFAADLTNTNLTNAQLWGTNLTNADLTNAILIAADLTGAQLSGVDLIAADLTDAILTNADLTDAQLSGTDLTDADLTGTDLTNAYFNHADLPGATGTPSSTAGADWGDTICPTGINSDDNGDTCDGTFGLG
jgi:uncharacterized protein YjbI with pentapeptide repeats